MTFDPVPDWLDLAIGGTFPSGQQSRRDAVRATPVPTCPDGDSLAALVRELRAEGTLSHDQMTVMLGCAELAGIRPAAEAGVPPAPHAD